MSDTRARYLSENLGIRAVTAVTTRSVDEVCQRHHCAPTTAAALGRTLTGAALLGASLKGKQDHLTLRINGGGPAGTIITTCDSEGNLRGYVQNPSADLPPTPGGKLDVAGVVGKNGFISAAYDLGLKEPYSGSASLTSGEIAQDLTYYLTVSEQVPSAVGLGVLVKGRNRIQAAGGFLIQRLPSARDGVDDVLAEIMRRCQELDSISHFIRDGAGSADIMQYVAEDLPFRFIGSEPVRFQCNCTREKAARLLSALSDNSPGDLSHPGGPEELTCQLCGQKYRFEAGEAAHLSGDPPDDNL